MAGFFALQWHITNECDQRCKHCYIFNSEKSVCFKEWTLEDARLLLDQYISFCKKYKKIPSLALTGGDPILHSKFFDIIKLIYDRGIPFNILGNPFHLSRDLILELKKSGCSKYQMSLDGLKDTHDSMRMDGSFDSTIEAIHLLNECGLPLVIMSTVSRINYQEIAELTRLLVSLRVHTCAFARYCPTHNDTDSNMTPDEYYNFLCTMWDTYSQLSNSGTKFTLKDHLWKPFLAEKGLINYTSDDEMIYDGCHCGNSHITLLEDKQIYACRRMDSPVGVFPQDSIESVFFGDKMDKYRDIKKIDGCNKCKYLSFCRGCRAVAFGSSNSNFYAKDPQCWMC